MKRKLFGIFLSLALVLSMMPLGLMAVQAEEVAHGTCGDGVTWTLDDEGLLTISGTGPMENCSGNTGATKNYGPYHDQIKSVVIEPGVTRIGSAAFFRQDNNYEHVIFSNLESVQIPDTVETIGSIAFDEVPQLEEITIPYGVKTIENQAFEESGLKSIELPDSVTSIGESAFERTGIKSIVVPDSVTSMGAYVFFECLDLESATLPDTLTSIPQGLFCGCSSLTTLNYGGALDSIGSVVFARTPFSAVSLTMQDKNSEIKEDAFDIEELPANVVTIYGEAGGTVESGAASKNYTFAVAQNNFTFDSNGGSGEMDALSVTFDGTSHGNFPACTFTNGSKIFAGWNTKADGTGISVEDESPVRIVAANGDVPLYAQWVEEADSVTVGVGEDTSSHVPFYAYYNYGVSQYVIPASDLVSIKGKTITAMEYYLDSESIDINGQILEIRLSEIGQTTISGWQDVTDSEIAFSGEWHTDENKAVPVTLTKPYLYNGGNLLVTVVNKTGHYRSGVIFSGVKKDGTSISVFRDSGAYDLSQLDVAPTQRNFLPKTTLICGDVTEYYLWVGGTQVTSANAADVFSNGKVSYDAESNTLTLNNANITGGSENTNYYGWGICYRGTDDFYLVANGTNTVKDDSYRTYTSYGIVIGEPNPIVYSEAEVNATITISEGASLTVSGGNINQSGFIGSLGIFNNGLGSLTINGAGDLIVSAKDNYEKSIGIVAQDVTIDGSCSVTATGGDSGDSMSAGIYCGNLNVPQSFTGTITAQSGSAPATLGYGTNGTFGILARGNNSSNGNISIAGGTVTASSGVRTGGSNSSSEYATGIYADYTISITDGATVNATGDGHGIFCYNRTTSINSSSVTAIGGNYAVNGLELTGVTAEASTEKEGSSLVPYDSSAINTYKYVKTTPESAPPVPTCDASIYIFDATENENDQGGRVIFENQEYGSNFTITKPAGTSVTVTAAPDEGYTFSAWRSGGTEGDFLSDSTEYTFTIEDTPGGIGIWAVFEKKPPAPPSGGGGGEPSYKVEVPDDVENGSVSVSPKSAKEGDTVTITVTPDEGFEVDGIKVTDKDGKEIEVKDNGDGTYSFVMPASKVTIEPTFKEDPDAHAKVCPSKAFDDLDTSLWYHEGTDFVISKGMMNGVGEKTFAPNDTTTRAMIVTILHRLEGEPEAEAASFTDLTQDWYKAAVGWAAANGIVNGYSETSFGPNDPITREQLAAILFRYAEYKDNKGEDYAVDLSKYEDASAISDWAVDAMTWCVASGIIGGVTETTLVPQGSATRAQVATILMRYCN